MQLIDRRIVIGLFAALAALLAPLAPAALARSNWGSAVARQDTTHLLGNPEAPVKVVSYISYTCPHCADFARIGDAAMQLAYLPGGKVSYEIRDLIRNPVDLSVSMLVRCGSADRFLGNHTAFFQRQPRFLALARSTSPAQRARWQPQPGYGHLKAIAHDLGFVELMRERGYRDSEIDACLANAKTAAAVEARSRADAQKYGIPGTPSFLIDDTLDGTIHDWPSLEKAIEARLR